MRLPVDLNYLNASAGLNQFAIRDDIDTLPIDLGYTGRTKHRRCSTLSAQPTDIGFRGRTVQRASAEVGFQDHLTRERQARQEAQQLQPGHYRDHQSNHDTPGGPNDDHSRVAGTDQTQHQCRKQPDNPQYTRDAKTGYDKYLDRQQCDPGHREQ
jgi:hypothetical protein